MPRESQGSQHFLKTLSCLCNDDWSTSSRSYPRPSRNACDSLYRTCDCIQPCEKSARRTSDKALNHWPTRPNFSASRDRICGFLQETFCKEYRSFSCRIRKLLQMASQILCSLMLDREILEMKAMKSQFAAWVETQLESRIAIAWKARQLHFPNPPALESWEVVPFPCPKRGSLQRVVQESCQALHDPRFSENAQKTEQSTTCISEIQTGFDTTNMPKPNKKDTQ